jgi:hypothetical protein
MKTTYLAPATDIILLSVSSHILEGSGGLLGDGENPEDLNLDTAGETNATSGNLSRRMWEDEEEEEEY